MPDLSEILPNRLRRNSPGLVAVTFMVISAAAPRTGVARAMARIKARTSGRRQDHRRADRAGDHRGP
jgi:hypothetical protein